MSCFVRTLPSEFLPSASFRACHGDTDRQKVSSLVLCHPRAVPVSRPTVPVRRSRPRPLHNALSSPLLFSPPPATIPTHTHTHTQTLRGFSNIFRHTKRQQKMRRRVQAGQRVHSRLRELMCDEYGVLGLFELVIGCRRAAPRARRRNVISVPIQLGIQRQRPVTGGEPR